MGSAERSIQTDEQMNSPEAYERAGAFFVGEGDIVIPCPITLMNGVSYDLSIIPPANSLPPNWDQAEMCNRFLHLSTRSRLAQAGLNLTGLRFYRDQQEGLMARFNARVIGPRPIRLEANEGLASFFNVDYAQPIVEQELIDLVSEGTEVQIGGEYGTDWELVPLQIIDFNQRTHINELGVIALRLQERRLGIVPSQEPITITSSSRELDHLGAREILQDQVFTELCPDERVPFWVGETRSVVTLGKQYAGVLTSLAKCGGNSWGIQTNSPLIKPGTNNTIRTELWRPAENEHGSRISYSGEEEPGRQYVFMRVYRSDS